MALIVEDGSIVADANSYVDLVFARAYADARGLSLPTDDTELEQQLIASMDYLEAQRARYQGDKTDPLNQELQWPRTGVYIDCVAFPSDEIPKELKNAQCQLAVEVNSGVALFPTQEGAFITREKVGPLETEYSEKIGTTAQPSISSVDVLLEPLFFPCGQKYTLTSLRI